MRPWAEIDVSQQSLVSVAVGLSRQQRGGQRIAHGADADLQGAAIAYQGTGVQPDEMILETHWHVRRGEQRGAVLLVDQQVEGIDTDFGITGHVGQIVMHLADHQDRLPGFPAPGDHRQQVEGDVRVAAQAQAIGMLSMAGHQLRNQVQACGIDVPGGVAVVAADVILLGRRAVEQAARLHEELLDVNVGRQVIALQAGEKIQLWIIAKDPFDKGFEKTLLQSVTQRRTAKAQGGVDRQLPLRQLRHTLIQRVDERVGFAQAQGQAHVDMRRQPRQHLIDRLLDRTQLYHPILPYIP
ncbi:hypothetical protein D3C76_1061060 [compost metagenome]